MKTMIITFIACLTLCMGCAHGGNVRTLQKQSNLATFLFGGSAPQGPAQKIPLALPARVGVAFVPSDPATATIPETTKKAVVEAVRSRLAKHGRYVAGAQTIPGMYLTHNGGINNLEQVARQFDVDVIVLLGANQFQKHERNPLAAFLDITLIGPFIIPGNTVDTSTVLEAAVYHVPSRSLIFRTDGADKSTSRSTQYGSSRTAQNDAVGSIEAASAKLVEAMGNALTEFEKFDSTKASEIRPIPGAPATTKAEPENYWERVGEYRSTGGGAFGIVWMVITGAAFLCAARIRRQH